MTRPSIAYIFVLITNMAAAQTTHLIRGFDFYYDPDTLIMVAGDSVKFQPQGIHDMIQTDSVWWAINQAIPIGGFETVIGMDTTFVIDTAGTYYFVCSPHGFSGMRGVLLVDSVLSTSIVQDRVPDEVRVYPVPARDRIHFDIGDRSVHRAEIRDMQGALVRMVRPLALGIQGVEIDGIRSGTYMLCVLDEHGTMLARSAFIIVQRTE